MSRTLALKRETLRELGHGHAEGAQDTSVLCEFTDGCEVPVQSVSCHSCVGCG